MRSLIKARNPGCDASPFIMASAEMAALPESAPPPNSGTAPFFVLSRSASIPNALRATVLPLLNASSPPDSNELADLTVLSNPPIVPSISLSRTPCILIAAEKASACDAARE